MGKSNTHVNIYHGYGHTNDLVVYGHVLKSMPRKMRHDFNHPFKNIIQLLRLFFVKPVADARVRLTWKSMVLEGTTEKDGLFKFEWVSSEHVAAGWHEVTVAHIDEKGSVLTESKGSIYVPHVTQYAFISDIDDTVLVSHSATTLKRLRELFIKSARMRSAFGDVAKHYELLSTSNTVPETPNPFFYVSSSEWNLYYYLVEFFHFNRLPDGTFLLSQLKQWHQLLKTGKNKHEGKLIRIMRIIKVFPLQAFVLIGDNTQSDPTIYEAIVHKYPGKIHAVYLRNAKKENEQGTRKLLEGLQKKGVHTCLFDHNSEAIEHSKKIGLISKNDL
ncbi:MAG: App1 family protein [Bacteroidota bacterium]